jgi:hypothetical protein
MAPKATAGCSVPGCGASWCASIIPIAVSTPALILDDLAPTTRRKLIVSAVLGWGVLLTTLWAIWREAGSKRAFAFTLTPSKVKNGCKPPRVPC